MKVSLNGENHELDEVISVEVLLTRLELDGAPCAVELNRTVVPRADHGATLLAEGDVVEIVTLVGGG